LLIDLPATARTALLAVSAASGFAIVALGLVRTARGPRQDSKTPVISPTGSST
jgi:hypothetical protein